MMDHVPPRSMFPDKLPSDVQMVSAPACTECHNANKKDDVVIRNLLISTRDTEQHPAVLGGLAGKRDRSFIRSMGRSGRDFHHFLQAMKLVDVKTPAGLYLGQHWAFDFDNPAMNRFVERLARALLWYEFQQPHFEGKCDWCANLELPTLAYERMQRLGRLRRVSDVFAYGITPLKDEGLSWAITNFYGMIEFFIRTSKTGQGRGLNGPRPVDHNQR